MRRRRSRPGGGEHPLTGLELRKRIALADGAACIPIHRAGQRDGGIVRAADGTWTVNTSTLAERRFPRLREAKAYVRGGPPAPAAPRPRQYSSMAPTEAAALLAAARDAALAVRDDVDALADADCPKLRARHTRRASGLLAEAAAALTNALAGLDAPPPAAETDPEAWRFAGMDARAESAEEAVTAPA